MGSIGPINYIIPQNHNPSTHVLRDRRVGMNTQNHLFPLSANSASDIPLPSLPLQTPSHPVSSDQYASTSSGPNVNRDIGGAKVDIIANTSSVAIGSYGRNDGHVRFTEDSGMGIQAPQYDQSEMKFVRDLESGVLSEGGEDLILEETIPNPGMAMKPKAVPTDAEVNDFLAGVKRFFGRAASGISLDVTSPTNSDFSPFSSLHPTGMTDKNVTNVGVVRGSTASGAGYHPYDHRPRAKRSDHSPNTPSSNGYPHTYHYPEHEVRDGISHVFQDEVTMRLAQRLASVLRNPKSRKALCSLQGDQAQLMVEYLYKFVLQVPLSIPWLQKHAFIALYRLSKSSLLYPYCYALKDIAIDSHESGGGFSDIYRGRHGDQTVCLKVVRLHQKAETDALLRIYAKEAILWGQLHHPNVVPFYGIYYFNETRRQICLVSPWMQNGNLVQYLRENPWISRRPFVHDIAVGLEYLHSRSLVHSDLKGVNVLVNDAGIACITDFGLSFIRTDQTLAYTSIVTGAHGISHHWAAPELLEDDKTATMASDVWALGCVFYEVLTGKLPFHGLSEAQVIRRLITGLMPQRPDPSDLKMVQEVDAVWGLIQKCWVMGPEQRPTCRQILETIISEGLTRVPGARPMGYHMHSGRQRFEEAMRESQEVPIDYTAVEETLCAMCTDQNRNSSAEFCSDRSPSAASPRQSNPPTAFESDWSTSLLTVRVDAPTPEPLQGNSGAPSDIQSWKNLSSHIWSADVSPSVIYSDSPYLFNEDISF